MGVAEVALIAAALAFIGTVGSTVAFLAFKFVKLFIDVFFKGRIR